MCPAKVCQTHALSLPTRAVLTITRSGVGGLLRKSAASARKRALELASVAERGAENLRAPISIPRAPLTAGAPSLEETGSISGYVHSATYPRGAWATRRVRRQELPDGAVDRPPRWRDVCDVDWLLLGQHGCAVGADEGGAVLLAPQPEAIGPLRPLLKAS